jgi:hypothetical protein
LMEELERYGFRGTFFLEPLGAHFFGRPGLAEVAQALVGRGHDVQLHTHPIQRDAAFRSSRKAPVSDDIGAYGVDEQVALLNEGRDELVRAGVPRASLRGFRAGNFGAANSTWTALARAGFVVSSNYDPGYFDQRCMMRYERASSGLFQSPEPGVYELSVTCFREGNHFRHLQITAVSSREMRDVLWQCRALGIHDVTIVTHSFELYFIDDAAKRRGRPNERNRERFRDVLAFLAAYPHDFEVDTVGALAARLPLPLREPSARYPRGRLGLRALRTVEQLQKRVAARSV